MKRKAKQKTREPHPNDFWAFSKMADHSFPGPLHFFHPRDHNGCQNPYTGRTSQGQIPMGSLPPPGVDTRDSSTYMYSTLSTEHHRCLLGCDFIHAHVQVNNLIAYCGCTPSCHPTCIVPVARSKQFHHLLVYSLEWLWWLMQVGQLREVPNNL